MSTAARVNEPVEKKEQRLLQTLGRRVEFLTVLRNQDYSIYYFGMLSSVTGHQMHTATQAWLVYYLTGSPAALGLVAGTQAVPGLVLMLFFGALADRMNVRKLIIIGEMSAGLLMALLATLIVTGVVEVWHIVVISFLTGLANSMDQPARRAIWPHLVPRDQFIYAISLNQTVWSGARIWSPGLAGLIVATVGSTTGSEQTGIGVAHYVSFLGFFIMAVGMSAVRLPPIRRSTGATVLHDVVDGLNFVRRTPVFVWLIGLSLAAGFFGHAYTVLMPIFANEYLNTGVGSYGLLLSATGVGGIIGTFGVASFGRFQNRPWLMIGGSVVSGGMLMLFALTSWAFGSFWLAVVSLGLVGATSSVFQVALGTVINLLVPDEFRGRIMGMRGIMWSLAPLGGLQAGLLASVTSAAFAVTLNGAMLIVLALAAYLTSPEIRNLRQLAPESMMTGTTEGARSTR